QVENFDRRERAFCNTLRESQQFIFSAAGMMKRFERGCRRAKESQRIFNLGAHDGDVAAVVARCLFLLVTGLLLFIDNDEAKIFNWGENRRARTDYDAGFAVSN